MMQAVFELATIDPHEPARRSVPAAEWNSYCLGYHRALAVALQVMDLAVVRFDLHRREQRRRHAAAAAAAAGLLRGGDQDAGEQIGLVVGELPDKIRQRKQLGPRKGELDRSIADGASTPELKQFRARFVVSEPVDAVGSAALSHSDSYRAEVRKKDPSIGGARIVYQVGFPSPFTMSYPCGARSERTPVEASASPGQPKTKKRRTRKPRG
jgi:hypothetical protein